MPTNLRVSLTRAMAEYVEDTNYRRLSSILAMVEHVDGTNYRRVSQLKVMVEYTLLPTSDIFGPKIQVLSS